MRSNKYSHNKIGVRVFTKYRPVSEFCPSCRKPMICLIKLSEMGRETLNFIYICKNPKCSQKTDIHKLIESGQYKLFGKRKV